MTAIGRLLAVATGLKRPVVPVGERQDLADFCLSPRAAVDP